MLRASRDKVECASPSCPDIHANREAFEAVLEFVRKQAPDQLVLLGDLVGYGPDPVYVVEKAADLVEGGAFCIKGNHDEAAALGRTDMTENARTAIEWTRKRLAREHLDFLAQPIRSASRSGDRLCDFTPARNGRKNGCIRDVEALCGRTLPVLK
ncbi:metallophosphoesterase family protein [Mesorhizobium atlanticum]